MIFIFYFGFHRTSADRILEVTHDDIPTAESEFLCWIDRGYSCTGLGRYDDMHANLISWGFLKGAAALALLGCGFRIASWLWVSWAKHLQ